MAMAAAILNVIGQKKKIFLRIKKGLEENILIGGFLGV